MKFVEKTLKLLLELVFIGCLCSVVYGVFLYSIPASFIVGGIMFATVAVVLRIQLEE